MEISSITNGEGFKIFASLITGGAFVGWYRERRRGKKDAYGFAIDMIGTLSARVDGLVGEVAELKAVNTVATEALAMLKSENDDLKHENERLKTALSELNKRVVG